jgi:hypothetical protein
MGKSSARLRRDGRRLVHWPETAFWELCIWQSRSSHVSPNADFGPPVTLIRASYEWRVIQEGKAADFTKL